MVFLSILLSSNRCVGGAEASVHSDYVTSVNNKQLGGGPGPGGHPCHSIVCSRYRDAIVCLGSYIKVFSTFAAHIINENGIPNVTKKLPSELLMIRSMTNII